MRDGENGAGKGTIRNSVADDGEGPRKPFFLVRESGRRRDELL